MLDGERPLAEAMLPMAGRSVDRTNCSRASAESHTSIPWAPPSFSKCKGRIPRRGEFEVDTHFVCDGIEHLVGNPDRKDILNKNRHDRNSFVVLLDIMTEGRLGRSESEAVLTPAPDRASALSAG